MFFTVPAVPQLNKRRAPAQASATSPFPPGTGDVMPSFGNFGMNGPSMPGNSTLMPPALPASGVIMSTAGKPVAGAMAPSADTTSAGNSVLVRALVLDCVARPAADQRMLLASLALSRACKASTTPGIVTETRIVEQIRIILLQCRAPILLCRHKQHAKRWHLQTRLLLAQQARAARRQLRCVLHPVLR
jgi:hypothetical protein